MHPSIIKKLYLLKKRYDDLTKFLSDLNVVKDKNKYRELSIEYSSISPIISIFMEYLNVQEKISESKNILETEHDEDLTSIANDDLLYFNAYNQKLTEKLQTLLISEDQNDNSNVFLEIRAGTGGNEAAIFAGDLFRMYSHYIERTGWEIEIINSNVAEHGGFKEIISRIVGNDVYSKLKFESGVHRVQRIPITEAQGRIHTSTCTVAVIAETNEINDVEINQTDLKIDTYRSSGAGGQHVNVTDSAVRITHIPSGVVVECQDERSQHKNKARAMSLLKAKLLAMEQSKQKEKEKQTRRSLIGTGDRSERIRTYNFPQGRLTDHRIGLTLYQLEKIIDGDLQPIIDQLSREYYAEKLAFFSDNYQNN